MSNEDFYVQAEKEFDSGSVDKSLWAKSRVQAEGDENRARYKYMEHRVKQLEQIAIYQRKEEMREKIARPIRKTRHIIVNYLYFAALTGGVVAGVKYIKSMF